MNWLARFSIGWLLRHAGGREALTNMINDVTYASQGIDDFTIHFTIALSAIRGGGDYKDTQIWGKRQLLFEPENTVFNSALAARKFSDNNKPVDQTDRQKHPEYDVYFQGAFVRTDKFEDKVIAQICTALKREFATEGKYVKTAISKNRIDVKLYEWQDPVEYRKQCKKLKNKECNE